MRAEFGLDSLPQHATHEVEPPTLIANPAMRLVENALRRYRARSGTPQRQQERWAGKRGKQGKARRREIKVGTLEVEQRIAGLQRAKASTDPHILVGELPEEIRLPALPEPWRRLLNGLRIIACQAETLTAAPLAPHLGKPAEVHALIKARF